MSTYENLHRLRQGIGRNRQPSYSSELEDLHRIVEEAGFSHPYDLDAETLERLASNQHFAKGCCGPAAQIPQEGFLYRITSIGHIVQFCGWFGSSLSYPECPSGKDSAGAVFSYLRTQYEYESQWLPLSRYAKGVLTSARGFTWWTTTEITEENLTEAAYDLGLVFSWLSPYALILRAPISKIGSAHTPTAIDGFTSPIFDPMPFSLNPSSGITIDVSEPASLRKGFPELTIGPVSVDLIEICPVGRSAPRGKAVDLDHELIRGLTDYHQGP